MIAASFQRGVARRGRKERQAEMLLGITPDQPVPADHPIRAIRKLVDAVLVDRLRDVLDPRLRGTR